MKAELIATTQRHPSLVQPFTTDADGAEAVIEFAGRACYQSWDKPNPDTATNKGYIAHIIDVGHFSVLEHSQATFYITGVPRSLTHELIRHRHFSFSELSQRYVDVSKALQIDPPAVRDAKFSSAVLDSITNATAAAKEAYETISRHLTNNGFKGKRVRQAARAVMPESTETQIIVTGNLRAWRHFLDLRATSGADDAIRELAISVAYSLKMEFPNVFADYKLETQDGVPVLTSSSPTGDNS